MRDLFFREPSPFGAILAGVAALERGNQCDPVTRHLTYATG
jgi:hypothetical protein